MGQRSIGEIMAEGQRLTLEHAELLRKSITGTLTVEESARKGVLEGYLLGLMGEAQAQGVGVGFGAPQATASDGEWTDEDDEMLGDFVEDVGTIEDEEDGGDRYGTGGYGFGY